MSDFDQEKQTPGPTVTSAEKFAHETVASGSGGEEVVYDGVLVHQDKGVLSKSRNLEAALDRKFGLETQAIDRVSPENKTHQPWHQQAVMALSWASGTMNISCFATGFSGWEFGLSLSQSICVTIFGTLLGAMITGWCATSGPGTGSRQISISRYSFGWWPSKIAAALNVISQIGWSSVGCITGGSASSAVSDGKVSLALGVVIIAVGSSSISFIGSRAISVYEKYAWLVFFIIFMVMYGETASHADTKTKSELTGANLSGQVSTLLAIVYGSSASWCSIVSDYYVKYPVDTSRTKVFLSTTFGLTIPTCIGMVSGCCVGSAMGTNQDWADTYDDLGVGYLIQSMLFPYGFAKFILVVSVLAGVGMNCINMYSAALSIQQFARPLAIIPRFFWTIICFGVISASSSAGKNASLTVLQNFLASSGYWNTSFFVIVFVEHYLFRKGSSWNYDLEGWNDPAKSPVGIAGLSAFLVGFIGWMLGMVTTWYVGPVAAKIGEGGGDIGNELTFVLTSITYIPVRYSELKWIGR